MYELILFCHFRDEYFSNNGILQTFVAMKVDLPIFTKSQLALRNGQEREEIWCAFKGNIYDLTDSRKWRSGRHYEHWAGQDLTEELNKAPHTSHVFDRFKIIGVLIE